MTERTGELGDAERFAGLMWRDPQKILKLAKMVQNAICEADSCDRCGSRESGLNYYIGDLTEAIEEVLDLRTGTLTAIGQREFHCDDSDCSYCGDESL